MILFFSLFSSFVLGTVLTLLDFFPVRSLSAENIITYFIYQQGNILQFKAEQQIFLYGVLTSLIIFAVTYFLIPLLFRPADRRFSKKAITFVLFLCALVKTETTTHLFATIKASMTVGHIYEDAYKEIQYTPPRTPKKKNLIVIYLESFENTYQSEKLFGKNLIPRLSTDYARFSNYSEMRGMNNTQSAIISSFCGLPYLPGMGIAYRHDISFLFNKNTCLTDILKAEGYKTFFYTSDEKRFANKNLFLEAHHVEKIEDSKSMVGSSDDVSFVFPDSENEKGFVFFNGIRDSLMFSKALKEIEKTGKGDAPFAFFLLTLNTHEEDGFLEPECAAQSEQPSDKKFKEVVSCTDKQVHDFISELKKQPFYKDTLIVVVGDHLSRKNTVHAVLEREKNRTVYNSFTNLDLSDLNLNRTFTALDLGPTVLEGLGFELKDGAMGLGRSLLRPAPTLIEEYGKEKLEGELIKKSEKYNDFLKK